MTRPSRDVPTKARSGYVGSRTRSTARWRAVAFAGGIVVLVVVAVPGVSAIWAKISIDRLAEETSAAAASDGVYPRQSAYRVARRPEVCDGLGKEVDISNFHRGGTVRVGLTCTIKTPFLGWSGLGELHVHAESTSPVNIDYTPGPPID
jgi:hypothetical protein